MAQLGLIKADEQGNEALTISPAPAVTEGAGFAEGFGPRLIACDTWWVGASDRRITRFENAYPIDHGMAYNSYVILDEATVLIDTCDRAVEDAYLANVEAVLGDRNLDYLIVNHMEPDHSHALAKILVAHPETHVYATGLAIKLIGQFFDEELRARCTAVAEGDRLLTGRHALQFVETPWVHWPEVMMTFDEATGVLFSADAFGTFGALDGPLFADQVRFTTDPAQLAEARRYYGNIVGKYGSHVLGALDKLGRVRPHILAPTHGHIWREDVPYIVEKYRTWASYEPEDQAVVVFYASVHGNTEAAAQALADRIAQHGVGDVVIYDVSATDKSYLVAEAFRASHLVFASVTYNNGLFTEMEDLIRDLGAHHLQNRHVSLVENGSWHATVAGLIRDEVRNWPGMIEVGQAVNIRSRVYGPAADALNNLAEAIAASVAGDTSYDVALSEPVDTTSGASSH